MLLTSSISDIVKDILYDLLSLLRFSDSDFASDKITSKSTYGYLFIVAGGLVSWKSKRSVRFFRVKISENHTSRIFLRRGNSGTPSFGRLCRTRAASRSTPLLLLL